MAKGRIVVLLVAFVAWCCVPGSVPSLSTPSTVTIAWGKTGDSKLWNGGTSLGGPIAPSSVRLKLHALRGLELTFGVNAVFVGQRIDALSALWLPDQRAAIRQGCPRFDRPDSARGVA